MGKTAHKEIIDLLLRFLDQAYDKKAWHGPTLRGSIRGVTYMEALWQPSPKHHNIWELVLHAAYWKYAVHRRLTGEKRGSFVRTGSNWFSPPEKADAAAWRKDLALLQKQHELLRAVVEGLPPSRLNRIEMIYGVASHDLYHAGQIQLLKRLQRGGAVNIK
jgi:hypothetical protein